MPALLVIDMQNDFCQPSSRLFVAGAPGAIPNVVAAVDAFRAAGQPVVFVLRKHRALGCDVDAARVPLFIDEPFLVQSPGADLVDGLAICPRDVVVEKRRWSAFFATDLDLVLRRLGITGLVIAGVQTPNCIRSTAVDASALDYAVTVLSDATASATPAVQEANLFDMKNMGIAVTTTQAAVSALAPVPA